MNRFVSLAAACFMLFAVAGCGDSGPAVPFDQSELDKHVEEHPMPMATAEDFIIEE